MAIYIGGYSWKQWARTVWCLALGAAAVMPVSRADETGDLKNTPQTRAAEKARHHEPDFSGHKHVGTASFYAGQFSGKTMADGAPMDPHGDNAASKTLPLGTIAKVTNIETGKSAVVTIEDRGPYVPGRIVDLSASTAQKVGITGRQGVAKVVVAPIAVPLPDGTIKLGAAAHDAHESSVKGHDKPPATTHKMTPIREAAVRVHSLER